MSRKSKKEKKEQADQVVAELAQETPLLIVEGKLNDEHCSWKYQINTGPTKGMVHGVNGKPNIVHDDLAKAFQLFKPHLAALCDLVDSEGAVGFAEVDNDAKVDLCHVTGFKIKGAGEAESISLIGSYHSMTADGRVECVTPFKSLEGHDNYRWYNELKEASDIVRKEIELYGNGKCTPPAEDARQLSMDIEEEEEATAE